MFGTAVQVFNPDPVVHEQVQSWGGGVWSGMSCMSWGSGAVGWGKVNNPMGSAMAWGGGVRSGVVGVCGGAGGMNQPPTGIAKVIQAVERPNKPSVVCSGQRRTKLEEYTRPTESVTIRTTRVGKAGRSNNKGVVQQREGVWGGNVQGMSTSG